MYLPDGTWLLGTLSKRPGAYASYIVPRDNVSIVGNGNTSILRVKSGENAKYSFNVMLSANNFSNCEFRDFIIDLNGHNNLLTKFMPARNNIGIGAINGAYMIVIKRVSFINNPGNQCIAFYARSAQGNVGMIDVSDCTFKDVGSGLSGNYNVDHSSIVLYGSNNKISNNIFGPSNKHVHGAMFEIHGPYSEAFNNYGSGYDKGWYFAKQYYPLTEIRVHDNYFENIQMAFDFSSLSSIEYGTSYIYRNVFKLRQGSKYSYFIGFPDVIMESMEIFDNKFIGNNTSSEYRLSVVSNTRNFIFHGNYVENFTSYGLLFSGDNNIDGYSLLNVYIKDNVWNDIGRYPIFNATGTGTTVKNIEITGNYFIRSTPYNAPAVYLGMKADRGIYANNMTDNKYSWDFAIAENAKNIHISQILNTLGGVYPKDKYGAVGSVMYDLKNKIIYRKYSEGNRWNMEDCRETRLIACAAIDNAEMINSMIPDNALILKREGKKWISK